jgi:virginiamycin B lyase
MPDERAADPHTPIFDQKGVLWFTVQRGNMVGRLDPKTGKVELRESPTPNSRPYGIVVNSKGVPFFCEFNSNKLASIDPSTLKITEYMLPEGARPRRLAVAADDTLYYTDYARGYLGHLDPKTGKVQEWATPGQPMPNPYGIAVTPDGMVWFSEAGVTPNTLVRFDPRTKTFRSWPIPSGGGVVRHMIATPEGRLYLACSGVNKVAVVEIRQ